MANTAVDQKWPDVLWIVRHGQSAGNVAREVADASGATMVDIDVRDVDVPLSPLGERQSTALGRWFAAMPSGERPTVVLASPYLRARRTAELIRAAGGLQDPGEEFVIDERLREKEFGILDRLTKAGVEQRYPDQAELRMLWGKFYHRPPGGESWCDVILRLRSALDTISLHYAGERVLIVCHQVIVLCMRYLLENLDEKELLAIDCENEIANCSVTTYAFDPARAKGGRMSLRGFNFVAPLREAGEAVTRERDLKPARR